MDDNGNYPGGYVETDEEFDLVDLGFAIDILSFSIKQFGFTLFNYTQLHGQFCFFEITFYKGGSERDKTFSLLGYNPRPFSEEKDEFNFSMFDTEHVTVDLFFMRFRVKKSKK